MPNAAIDAVRNQSMVLPYFKGDRPECSQVCVRTVEEPETHGEKDGAGDKRGEAKRVIRKGQRR